MSGSRALGALAASVTAPAVVGLAIAAGPGPAEFAEMWWRWIVLAELFGAPAAFALALFVGYPLYRLLSRWWRLRWWNAALGGLAIGAAAYCLLEILNRSWPDSLAEIASALLAAAGAGVAAGLAFWWFARDDSAQASGA